MEDPIGGLSICISQSLPLELIEQICILAAEADRKCAYQLAFVSRAVCQATAKARWRVVAITSVHQYMAFYREIHAISDQDYNLVVDAMNRISGSWLELRTVRSLNVEGVQQEQSNGSAGNIKTVFDLIPPATSRDTGNKRRGTSISFPSSSEPHRYLQHLSIDLPESIYEISSLCGLGSGWILFKDVCQAALHSHQYHIQRHLSDAQIEHSTPHSIEDIATLLAGLDNLCLDHLSLGAGAEVVLKWVGKSCSVKEVTTVNTPSTENKYLLQIGDSLQRLHIIGRDVHSKTSGIPPPWNDLHYLCSQSTQTTNLTHLRFDTRKFSFKPAEIFASRLRPLIQEVTVESQTFNASDAATSDTYRHIGPRHAAPSRGAGHFSQRSNNISSLIPIHQMKGDTRANFLREKMGVGRLDFLQFAWDPMSTSERREEDIPPHQKARYSALNEQKGIDTGGWPREMRGAWTERSDRDIAPSFAVELRDAINSLYGWHTPGVEPAAKYVARKDSMSLEEQAKIAKNVAFSPDHAGEMVCRIKDGLKEADQVALLELEHLLSEEMATKGLDLPCKLQYGVRAPQSLINLGGKAPFEPEDQLRLFEDRARGGKGAWP